MFPGESPGVLSYVILDFGFGYLIHPLDCVDTNTYLLRNVSFPYSKCPFRGRCWLASWTSAVAIDDLFVMAGISTNPELSYVFDHIKNSFQAYPASRSVICMLHDLELQEKSVRTDLSV